MKFTAALDTLAASLDFALLASGTKADNLHLSTKGSAVAFLCSDGTRSAKSPFVARIEKDGSCVVSAKLFRKVVAACSATAAEVQISATSKALTVDFGGGHLKLHLRQAEVGALTLPDASPGFTLEADQIRGAMRAVAPAAGLPEEILGCLCLDGTDPGAFTFVASDRRRCHRQTIPLTTQTAPAAIPPGAFPALSSLAKDGKPVRVRLSPRAAEFISEAGEFITLLGDGNFPPWRKLFVPLADAAPIMTVSRVMLLDAVGRAAVAAATADKKKTPFVTLTFSPVGVKVSVESDEGFYVENVAAEIPPGTDATIRIHPDYLTDALEAEVHDTIIVSVGTHQSMVGAIASPILVSGKGSAFAAIIMPMKI